MNPSNMQAGITVPDAPSIPGLTFRHFDHERDFALMTDLINICNPADKVDEVTSEEELTSFYRNLTNCDLDDDVLVAEVGGQMIAYTRVWWADQPGDGLIYMHIGNLHPDWRRRGLGRAMMAWNQARLRTIAAQHDPAASKAFRSFFGEHQHGDQALLDGDGYEPERYFFEMKRALSQPIPEPQLPEGLEIRPVEEEHYRQIWDAKDEAFRDHWGYSQGTEKDYQRWLENPNFDPQLWKVAWEGDQVAGMILNVIFHNEDQQLGRLWGWTDPICVRRPWRRRGLATNLLYASLRELKERDREWAALAVDVANPSGALKLYKDAGFETFTRFETRRKPLE